MIVERIEFELSEPFRPSLIHRFKLDKGEAELPFGCRLGLRADGAFYLSVPDPVRHCVERDWQYVRDFVAPGEANMTRAVL